ncbi:MAG: amidohydrolase family protein [Candidatus Lambdaproteobacteria bacterium]|nr:amidohydrolase family protein [Candidatus Lambdaproteobacteria bacterium]
MQTDCHVHIYDQSCALTPGRRYTPEVWAPVEEFIRLLDAHGLTHGLPVQPSFLGTDNSYLVQSLKKYPGRLRGIAVVAPDVSQQALEEMAAAGVVGTRISVTYAKEPPRLRSPEWRRLLDRLAALEWVLQVHAQGEILRQVLRDLEGSPLTLVIDHCGRPDPARGVKDEAFQALLKAAQSGRVWAKLSIADQQFGVDMRPIVQALIDGLGPERLVWGTNWPFPGEYRKRMTYGVNLEWLEQWVPDAALRARILGANPERLFRFDLPPGAKRGG